MALIKCLECGRDISDKAPTCPNCGNPINGSSVKISSFPGQPLKIEPELTSKTWKKVKLVAWGIIVSAFFIGPAIGSPRGGDPDMTGVTIFGFVFIGILVLIVGHIGAWYADKRTS